VVHFLCCRPSAAVPPGLISRASSPLPFPGLPSLIDGARLSAPSSPKSPSSARPRGNAGQIAGDGPTTRHHPSITRMPMCASAALSRHVGCGASWRPVTAGHLRLPSSSLRRSDSGANRSTTRPRAGCFAAGQLLPCLCMPLGCPVPLLTEASCRPATPVDRC
jgi:hypothetical protein